MNKPCISSINARIARMLKYPLTIAFLIIFFPLRGQQYKITHPAALSGLWMNSPESNDNKYIAIYTGHEGVSGTEQDQMAQLFINWMANNGGISLSAVNGSLDEFYHGYINEYEYNEYLGQVQSSGELMKQSDYFESKYANGLPGNMNETKIKDYKTLAYTKTEEDDMGVTTKSISLFIMIEGNSGILTNGGLKYIKDKSTQSLEDYEALMYQHLNELNFEQMEGGLDQSQTGTSSPPTQENESEVPWTVIIGVISAATIAAIVRKLIKKGESSKQDKKKDDKQEEEEAHYILQLNKDSFSISLNEIQSLIAEVWKVTTKGKMSVASSINIQNPEKQLKINIQAQTNGIIAQLSLDKAPERPSFNLLVSASAEGKSIQKNVEIVFAGKQQIVVETLPDNKRTLRPDTNRVLTCCAEVVDEGGKSVPEKTKKIQFQPQSDWIDLSDPIMDKNKICINIAASNPDQVRGSSRIPDKVVLTLLMEDVEENEEVLKTDVTIQLLDCKLESELSTCSFPVTDQQTEISFKAFIEQCVSEEKWNFDASYKNGEEADEALTSIEMETKNETEVKITLKGPIVLPGDKETQLSKTLVISAWQGDEKPLERHIKVFVTQVGLYIKNGVDGNGTLSYLAQGLFEKDIEFVLYKYDERSKEIIVDSEGLKHLSFQLKNEEEDIINFESVLKVGFGFSDLVGNIPYGRYHLKSEEEMPGFGDVFELVYQVKAPFEGKDEELFQKDLTLKVKTFGIGYEFPDWVEAYNNCKKVVLKLVPNGETQTKLFELLEKRKYTLGAEGLNELRKRMWKIAYNLILAEGAEGYKAEEKWANAITTTLEWTEWAGDLAYNALVAYYMKGSAAGTVAVSMLKSEMIEALNYYIYESGGIEGYVDKQYEKILPLLLNVAKGRLISVENIEMVVKKNKPLAITIFVSCEFLYNLYQTKSVVEAAKLTAAQIRDEFIISKLTLHLHKNQLKYNIKLTTVDESLNDVIKSVKTKDGKQYIEVDKLMEIMRDPAQVRTLKNHAPDWLKKVFDDSRSEIYNKHDTALKKFIADTYKINGDDIKIDDFRTPGTGDSYNLNTDRDYRVLRKVKTSEGKEIWIELQRDNWIDKSYETFGELTGKPYGISPKEWAEKHLQRGTDRFDAEAGKDYADHIYNADTGEVVKGDPNIVKVKHGEGTLYDAEGLGKMYQNKVMNALEPGTIPEAYAQAKKAVESLKKVKQSYTDQKLDVNETPDKLNKAMEVIESAKTDANATPEAVSQLNQKLNDLGYKDVGDVAKDIANEFNNLKRYDRPGQIYKVS